ncbi:unnamed protein product [Blepharisma stoltei]|uniref:U-box domain-containing protein n=1 Tax=Blepharisma stoltei TaxID=1481888 RepID=A0AAU9INS8_9CILI|nr:unnamed protein product [Blepharisma stoltei]
MAAVFVKIAIAGIILVAIAAKEEPIRENLKKFAKWLKRKIKGKKVKVPTERRENDETEQDAEGMEALLCPISHELMTNPVITPYGHCFQREHIERWLESHDFCPLTRQNLSRRDLKPCYTLKYAVDQYIKLQDKLKFE